MSMAPTRTKRTLWSGRRRAVFGLILFAGLGAVGGVLAGGGGGGSGYVVLSYNDLGMHCMNEDFSELVILPPFNNLRAQVIRRGGSPEVVSEDDIDVTYAIPNNTHSADKTNFWTYAEPLFGVALPPDIGLTGNGMAGAMDRNSRYYEVTGIPITPIDDSGRSDPYPLATVSVNGPLGTAETRTVVPVSTEISCNLCHVAPPGKTVSHQLSGR